MNVHSNGIFAFLSPFSSHWHRNNTGSRSTHCRTTSRCSVMDEQCRAVHCQHSPPHLCFPFSPVWCTSEIFTVGPLHFREEKLKRNTQKIFKDAKIRVLYESTKGLSTNWKKSQETPQWVSCLEFLGRKSVWCCTSMHFSNLVLAINCSFFLWVRLLFLLGLKCPLSHSLSSDLSPQFSALPSNTMQYIPHDVPCRPEQFRGSLIQTLNSWSSGKHTGRPSMWAHLQCLHCSCAVSVQCWWRAVGWQNLQDSGFLSLSEWTHCQMELTSPGGRSVQTRFIAREY